MSEPQSAKASAAGDADLTVYIARDGAEIGECRRADVEQLIREGELLPTDHYWHEGMPDWLPLAGLQQPEPAAVERIAQLATTQRIETEPEQAPPQRETPPTSSPPSWRTLTITPELRKHLIIAALICGGFILALVIAVLVIRFGHDATPVRPAAVSEPTPIVDREEDLKLRDKAAGELRAKLEALPARAEPPLHTFYYDVSVNMRRSGSPRTPWEALVRGSENTVDPQSEQTTKRTEFLLRTEYRDGQWTFKHYKATARDFITPEEREEEHDEMTVTPPALVTMLGLKVEPPDAARR